MTRIIKPSEATKGPWMAAASPSSVVGWPVVGPMGRSICNVSWMPRNAYPDVSDADYAAFEAECWANAYLLAAARTMYEALQFYANPEIYKPHPYGPAFDRRDLSATAIAALAKAVQS